MQAIQLQTNFPCCAFTVNIFCPDGFFVFIHFWASLKVINHSTDVTLYKRKSKTKQIQYRSTGFIVRQWIDLNEIVSIAVVKAKLAGMNMHVLLRVNDVEQ